MHHHEIALRTFARMQKDYHETPIIQRRRWYGAAINLEGLPLESPEFWCRIEGRKRQAEINGVCIGSPCVLKARGVRLYFRAAAIEGSFPIFDRSLVVPGLDDEDDEVNLQ
jgi:hypothetical protein